MTIFQAIILGIIQGLTEFLPVSSSAHLVLAPYFFGWDIPVDQAFIFDVLVQMGTLFAVIYYFRKDLFTIISAFLTGIYKRRPFDSPDARLGWYILIATIPAGLSGLFLKDLVKQAFQSHIATAIFLLWTAIILLSAEFFGKRRRQLEKMSWQDAVWIGIAQALSIFPGISRSGSTISGGMVRNFERSAAARFSFLMSIPIMFAAGFLSIFDLLESTPNFSGFLLPLFAGFISALIVGYCSIHWLLTFVKHRTLHIFAIYCFILGMITLLYTYAQ